MEQFDLVVIGGGPGGYVAAIRAAQLKMKVALIEKEHLGGVCLNWGCIPTKALLRSAEIYSMVNHAAEFGIKVDKVSIDFKKIIERSRNVSAQLAGGVKGLLKKNKVVVFEGHGRLTKEAGVVVSTGLDKKETKIQAKHIILATGARARELPAIKADGKNIWTARHAMVPESLPKSLIVIGSGAIGIEFASFYNTFGVQVTVIEMQDRILPQEDVEISALAQKSFEEQGIKFHLNSTVESVKTDAKGVQAVVKTKEGSVELKAEKLILAIGIIGNTEDLGLEHTQIKTERGQIVVNEWCETNQKGVYAIGDLVGAPWLAHKASHEGIICVEKIAGLGVKPLKIQNIPGCTYSAPQVASIGLTEKAATEKGYKIKVGRFPYLANGKAQALGEPKGMVKTIFDEKTGELLGAHMIGAEVTELIQGFAIGKTLETTEEELMHTIFPHPTLSEMMHESVLNAYGKTIHY